MDSRLEQILVCVRAGEGIKHAVQQLGLYDYYFREVDPSERAPVKAAYREVQARKRLEAKYGKPQQANKPRKAPNTSALNLAVPEDIKERFQRFCEQNGQTMAFRLTVLIKQDLKQNGAL